jgi:hypothetical protein
MYLTCKRAAACTNIVSTISPSYQISRLEKVIAALIPATVIAIGASSDQQSYHRSLFNTTTHRSLTETAAATTHAHTICILQVKHGIIVAVRKPGETGPVVTRYPVPVPPEGLRLKDGDEITIGKTVLVLHQVPPPQQQQSNSAAAAGAAGGSSKATQSAK